MTKTERNVLVALSVSVCITNVALTLVRYNTQDKKGNKHWSLKKEEDND